MSKEDQPSSEEEEDTFFEGTEKERIQLMWSQMMKMRTEARANRKRLIDWSKKIGY
jgi:hypothetical protein